MGLGNSCGAEAGAWNPESNIQNLMAWLESQLYTPSYMTHDNLLNLFQSQSPDL